LDLSSVEHLATLVRSSPDPAKIGFSPNPVRSVLISAVQLTSPLKIHVFHLATWPSSPPGPPFSVIPYDFMTFKTL